MTAFLVQIVKVLLPCIAAGAVVRYIQAQNEKKQKEFECINQDNADGEAIKYEIAYPAVIYIIGYVGIAFFGWMLIGSYVNNQFDWGMAIIGGSLFGLSFSTVLGTHVWKIWVDGEHIIYRGYNGLKHYYTFSDITKYTERADGAIIAYVGKKRIFKIDNNLPERYLLKAQMKERKIPGDIDGMTNARFRLKPRMVYVIVAAMCVGFCGWAAMGLFKQIGADNVLFYIMLICFLISTVVLLDLLLDRFSVDGKQVTRRRGLVTKRFSMDEVDYIRIQTGMLRDNVEFYVNGEKITQVWTLNQPMKLLEQKMGVEGIKTKKDKKHTKKGKKKS